jgi:acyl phosphate:glycerol-3-phosphate acyltransferase
LLQAILIIAGSYALGCIVGAYYIVRLRTGADVRTTGSGNAGARNVMRSGDRTSAVATFVWDLAKGSLAVWAAHVLAPQEWAAGLALLFVIVGHIWPVQLGFWGGKGVATLIGGMFVMLPLFVAGEVWPNIIFATIACALVVIAHQPAFERHRQMLGAVRTPTQENGT